MSVPEGSKPHRAYAEWILPTIAVLFSAYYLTTITEAPWIARTGAMTVSILLAVSIVALAIREIRRRSKADPPKQTATTPASLPLAAKRLGLMAGATAFAVLLEPLGLAASTGLFLASAILILGGFSAWRKAALTAIAGAILAVSLFLVLFETRFPTGPLDRLILRAFDER